MPKKILILRFSSIGDIVLTTPVIRCIKLQIPGVEIHYATKKQYGSILEANPYLHKIHLFEEKKLPALLDQLDAEKFDLIIDLHHNLRTFLIKNNLNIESRSFNKLNFQKWLMVKLKFNKLPQIHIVERYLNTLKDYGIVNDGQGLDYFIPEPDIIPISKLPSTHQNGFVAVVIGALHYTKKLPTEKLIELCTELNSPVVLIGGKEDIPNGEIVVSSNPEKIFNACGKYNINQSASLISQADKVITHDTGMMHIAAALQKEIISVWGNTIPEFGMYPYFGTRLSLAEQKSLHTILEINNLRCRPCSKIGFEHCPKGHFKCMKEISFNRINP